MKINFSSTPPITDISPFSYYDIIFDILKHSEHCYEFSNYPDLVFSTKTLQYFRFSQHQPKAVYVFYDDNLFYDLQNKILIYDFEETQKQIGIDGFVFNPTFDSKLINEFDTYKIQFQNQNPIIVYYSNNLNDINLFLKFFEYFKNKYNLIIVSDILYQSKNYHLITLNQNYLKSIGKNHIRNEIIKRILTFLKYSDLIIFDIDKPEKLILSALYLNKKIIAVDYRGYLNNYVDFKIINSIDEINFSKILDSENKKQDLSQFDINNTIIKWDNIWKNLIK
jgi:hypothetical protein